MTIKTVIFDLGNVIIDVDSTHTEHKLQRLGIERASEIFTVQEQNALCDRFECGHVSPEEFIQSLSDYSSHDDVDHQAIQHAWESMILHTTEERLNTLKELRDRYRVLLLSNTNQIHYDHINRLFAERYQIECLDTLFDKAYYSFQVGMRKPMPDIFLHVLEDQSIDAHETVFIDDLAKNIDAAKACGIQTWHAQDLDKIWSDVRGLMFQ